MKHASLLLGVVIAGCWTPAYAGRHLVRSECAAPCVEGPQPCAPQPCLFDETDTPKWASLPGFCQQGTECFFQFHDPHLGRVIVYWPATTVDGSHQPLPSMAPGGSGQLTGAGWAPMGAP